MKADPWPMEATTAPLKPEEVLVVIPTLNEAAHIEACLASLMAGDDRLGDIPFVVADGGSSDATRSIVTRLSDGHANVRLIDNPRRLQSAAVNRAAETCATGATRHLVRCDAHALYPPGYVIAVAEALRRTGADSVVTPMDAVGRTCFQKANAWIVDTPLGSGGAAHRGGHRSGYVDHGHHAGFNLATFRKLGGYDESFSHNEDGEYDHRLAEAGGRIYLDADIRVAYTPRATARALAKQYFQYGRGRARNLLKHGARPRLRQVAPILNLVFLVAAASTASALHPVFLLYPAAYVAALLAASIWIAARKRSVCGLFAGLASGVMHLAWALGFLRQWLIR